MLLRCKLDGLLLPAFLNPDTWMVTAFDGDEGFPLEPVEALYYELVAATAEEALALERPYRLLKRADDFRVIAPGGARETLSLLRKPAS